MDKVLQSPRWQAGMIAAVAVLFLAFAGYEYAVDSEPKLRHPSIRITANAAVLLWGIAEVLMLSAKPRDWRLSGEARRLRQFAWALGCCLLSVHFAAAFQLAHGWSHADAFRQTEETAGFGAGVFVNYALGSIWLIDAIWFAAWPGSYVHRPRWLGGIIHGFLGFIVFNATVVFGMGYARMLGIGVFIAIPNMAIHAYFLRRGVKLSYGE